jgi:2-succinyl-5-enolpyruvyl-6-hydroxy-3-cyclohexene-1-carboxylate synthase
VINDRSDVNGVGEANLRFARALVGELHQAGVAAAFVCPGSRSTPLALAIAECDGLPHGVHVDERSAAFQALGFAKASGRPALLLCTSGTAGANFLPAVAEAHRSRVPLVVLTADRPPELRAWGAAQTMEQRTLYAGFTRWSEEAPCPSERGVAVTYAFALGRRAVLEATGPAPGPGHLNQPVREPLLPESIEPSGQRADAKRPRALESKVGEYSLADLEGLAQELRGIERGVLVFGPDSWDPMLGDAVHALAMALDWPVLADPASGLRAGEPHADSIIHGADLFLRDAAAATALAPQLIVRCGGQPTSAAINGWMARHATAEVWLVDPANGFRDPQHRATRVLRASSRQFCRQLSVAVTGPAARGRVWRSSWQQADRVARAGAVAACDMEQRFLTPHLARAIWAGLPDGAALYAANSMVIRDVDAFADHRVVRLRLLANRGVNGIDGMVSSALGAAAALGGTTVLWCGDLALLHDVSGLLAGTMQQADLTIVVSNDDGGGIFEYLPAARTLPRPVFERLFAVPHGLDLCGLARGLGWQAARVESAEAFSHGLTQALAGGRHVLEVPVDRAANTAFHAAVNAAVSARLRQEWSA